MNHIEVQRRVPLLFDKFKERLFKDAAIPLNGRQPMQKPHFPIDVFSITKSGSVLTKLNFYSVRHWFMAELNTDSMWPGAWSRSSAWEAIEQLLARIDVGALKDVFIEANKKEIMKRKAAAKLKREANKANKGNKDKRTPPPPPTEGTLVRLPDWAAKRWVQENPKNITCFIEQPSWLRQAALRCSSKAINYIRDPQPSDYDQVVKNTLTGIQQIRLKQFSKERQKELKKISLESHAGQSIRYMTGLDEELAIIAVTLNKDAIRHIGKPSAKIKRLHAMKWKI